MNQVRKTFPVPTLRNTAIVLAQFAAIGLTLKGAASAESTAALLSLAVWFGILMNSVYATIHEAYHGILFPNRRINDTAGILLALFFPASFHLLRQGHLGHHIRNRSDDEAFDIYFDRDSKLWKFLAWYGILTGFYWLLVVLSNFVLLLCPSLMDARRYGWDRTSQAFLEGINPAQRRLMQAEAALVLLVHSLLLFYFSIPFGAYTALYLTFGWMWSALQYVHHYQTERDVRNGAKNLYIWKPLDFFWLNHNFHLTHHRHPTIPWLYLEDVGSRENPGRSFLLTAYLAMWRGPKHSTEHVANQYTGKIIR